MCAVRLQIRRDSLENWATNNPILAQGEYAWVIGTDKFKIGDGIHAWNELDYIKFGDEAKWGNITGDIEDQTDLIYALNGKVSTGALDTEILNRSNADTALGLRIDGTLPKSDVENSVTSTSTTKALSAKMGKDLSDRIAKPVTQFHSLKYLPKDSRLAMTDPTYSPYPYRTGDYFLVLNVADAGGTNYRPEGDEYVIGEPSTTVETGAVTIGSWYIYDGTQWILQSNSQQTVSFTNIAGDPYDNSNLASALNEKQDELVSGTNIKTVNSQSILGSGDLEVNAGVLIEL